MEIRGRSANIGRNQSPSTVDDLFNYDAGLDEILRETEGSQRNDSSNPTSRSNNAPVEPNGASLGLDEEVKVAPKRRPVAKLDEARLLSPAGIPKLRKNAKTKLKFKGKGHEYSDAMRLLNFYQLWLDDLYPRAKFADGLAMIEKLGHSKRVQIMRKEWIDEGKPKLYTPGRDEEESDSPTQLLASNAANPAKATDHGREQNERDKELFPTTTINTSQLGSRMSSTLEDRDDTDDPTDNQMPSIFGGGGARERISEHNFANGTDGNDDLFVQDDSNNDAHGNITIPSRNGDNTPEDDELDALLAEHQRGGMPSERQPKPRVTTIPKKSSWGPPQSAFDDLDAMDDFDF